MTRLPRSFLILLAAGVCSVWLCPSANAQFGFGQPADRPAFSPYLNLFRNQGRTGGANTLLNYYGLVLPQNQALQQAQQFSQQLSGLQVRMQNPAGQAVRRSPLQYSQLGATGHPVAFMTVGAGRTGGATFGGGLGSGFASPVGAGSFGVGSFGTAGLGTGSSGLTGGLGGGGFGGGLAGGFGGGGFNSGAFAAGFGTGAGGFSAGGGFGYGTGTVTGHPAVFSTGPGTIGQGNGY